jgi:hypothetical protein
VGLIAMTGVMSRHVVTIGAIFLIVCGLVPKVGAVIRLRADRGAGRRRDRDVRHGGRGGRLDAVGRELEPAQHGDLRHRLSLGLGLQLEPGALQYLPDTLKVLATSGICPRR